MSSESQEDYRQEAVADGNRYQLVKQVMDRGVALTLLIVSMPLMLVLVALTRVTSRGPGIFRQTRVGKDGRTFVMYKIRTMCVDAEAGTGPVWAKSNDPRITGIGLVLRKLHLDELPQLWNVSRGDMSLVGPRPERPEFVSMLTKKLPRYEQRFSVRPGVTGLAQINLPPDTDLESVRKKLVLDLNYIEEMNPLFDAKIVLATIAKMLHLKHLVLSPLGLGREVPEAEEEEEKEDSVDSQSSHGDMALGHLEYADSQ